jgi:hypothetical protein
MKKILLLSFLMSLFYNGIAQIQEIEVKTQWITIGELKWLSTIKAQLQYTTVGKDTTYLLYLKDEQTLKNSRDMSVIRHFSIRFNSQGNTLNELKRLLFSFFENENAKNKEYDKTFRLGETMVNVQHYRKLTGKTIMFYTKDGYILFTKRELAKLFGQTVWERFLRPVAGDFPVLVILPILQ